MSVSGNVLKKLGRYVGKIFYIIFSFYFEMVSDVKIWSLFVIQLHCMILAHFMHENLQLMLIPDC